MEVPLTPELAAFVREQVASGPFQSADEVVREALRQMAAATREGPMTIEELRREIDIGVAQADAGGFAEFSAEKLKLDWRRALGR